jgi:hypothetical protein
MDESIASTFAVKLCRRALEQDCDAIEDGSGTDAISS